MSDFNAAAFRQHFPFFAAQPDWIYLDNAATTHKPFAVLETLDHFYRQQNSNVHRGAHKLSQMATILYEEARSCIQQYVNAAEPAEIIFTSGTTAALNQLAFGLMHTVLKPGDRILISALEHHANIVSWQLHCQRFGVILDVIPLDSQLQLDQSAFEQLLTLHPKVVSLTQVSNALGTVLPLASMLQAAKAAGAITVVDGAQGIVWDKPDLQQLAADFYCFSGHKLYGPTGIGVLYGKRALLERLTPLLGGGEMIEQVSFSHSSFNHLPARLEAGTPHIAGALGLAAAIRFISQFDVSQIKSYKRLLLKTFHDGLQHIPGIVVLSPWQDNAGIVTLNLQGEHSADVATLLNEQRIAVRAGRHCAMPLFDLMATAGAVRFAFAPYNQISEVEQCLKALTQAAEILAS
ncbi:cysteine desulfurase [Alishewanella longhuensis]|uniref:cysteine desulfurase n=1 Tax=Alishewanella longhuensis TaxID=1091037 RepID=A0ABQ3KX15_9ALTE|nr:cysteine desulfurase [Alishewanella longhuensis]GHG66919.1 cysteine desulfurase [Alishewanella longhuensis]